mgnify:CR=1 FL=1
MKAAIKTVSHDISPIELADLLNKDGAAIVEGVLNQDQLSSINSELDCVIAETEPGLRHATNDFFVEFYGSKTIRLDGLPAKSKTFLEIMQLKAGL